MTFTDLPAKTVLELELANPDSTVRAIIAGLTAPQTLDGGNAASTYSGSFNFDGGSAA